MLIDCDTCAVRGVACSGCLVNALIETPAEVAGLTAAERQAIEVFARAGFEVEVVAQPATTQRGRRPGSRRRHVA